jgi:hypothetical protein
MNTKSLSMLLLLQQLLAPQAGAWQPDRAFAQAGFAGNTQTYTVGISWTWDWQQPWAGGQLGGYWETSIGRWSTKLEEGRRASAWVTQLGITPVLRWTPNGSRLFLELGIGANFLTPIYRSRDKRFSTTFNFGDHLAVGWRLAEGNALQEIALRVQHYSNASIRRPNPGEDFLQIRYVRTF